MLREIAPKFYDLDEGILAIGGGHGLAATLASIRTLDKYPVGIVSVADDGGSSGRLRDEFGHIPPGDLRRCVSALLPKTSPWQDLLEFRFASGELQGHALGNLIFTALTGLSADPVGASVELCHLVGATGVVLPACSEPLTLVGQFADMELLGQALLAKTSGLTKVGVRPSDPVVPSVVLEAIVDANHITLGPGSLYTSIIAVCGIPAIRDAIAKSSAQVIFVANLAPQVGEGENLTVAGHVRVLMDFGIDVDVVLYDDHLIELGDDAYLDPSIQWILTDLSDKEKRVHNPALLGQALGGLLR